MGTEEEEAWNNFNVDSITLYGPEDSNFMFEKLVDVSLEELKAAHNESANVIVGTWTSGAVNRINLSGTEIV